jgi:hypothetical protein
VNGPWAVLLPHESTAALARLRSSVALGVCESAEGLWLRGPRLEETLDKQLRLIPGGRRFAVVEEGQLLAAGNLVPLGRVPEGPWGLLSEWLEISLPPFQERGSAALEPVTLMLVPATTEREPTLLVTTLAQLASYAATAPQWRIDRWTFAATSDGKVIVRGTPLPPIPGTQWVLDQSIATPAGLSWSPPVDAAVVQQLLGLAEGEIALLRADRTCDRIAGDHWVRASRSAIRGTQEAAGR